MKYLAKYLMLFSISQRMETEIFALMSSYLLCYGNLFVEVGLIENLFYKIFFVFTIIWPVVAQRHSGRKFVRFPLKINM